MAADEASGTSGETPGVCTESDLGSDPGTKLERARQARRHEKTQAQAQAQAGGTSGVDGVSGAGGTSGMGGSGLAAVAATTAAGAAAAGASGMGDDDEPMTDARRKEEAAFKRQQRDELAKRAFDAITGSTGTATLAAIKKQIALTDHIALIHRQWAAFWQQIFNRLSITLDRDHANAAFCLVVITELHSAV